MGICGNCTAWRHGTDINYQADPDIAGIGIISVYIGSAFITLCLSAVHLVLTNSDTRSTNTFDRVVYRAIKKVVSFKIGDDRRDLWVPVIQKLVLSLSDQQLLTGLAVLIAGFWTHCSISVYHFALVNDLAWFSATVHLTTLSVLQGYFLNKHKHVQRNWRVALMAIMALLLIASTVMEGHYEWYDSWPYDAQCLFDNLIGNIGGSPRYWMSVSLALICINYPLNIIPLFEPPMLFLEKWLETKPRAARDLAIHRLESHMSHMNSSKFIEGSMRRFTCTLLITAVRAISWTYFALLALFGSRICSFVLDIFWFAYSLWGIIEDRDIPPTEMDGNENAMTFGQIMPILLLTSLVLVFREAYDDQVQEMKEQRHRTAHSDSSQLSLVRTQSPSTEAAPTASQNIEMSGALQDTEDADHVGDEISPPRRVDTEMGGRSQTSGLESGQLQRRWTLPAPGNPQQLQ